MIRLHNEKICELDKTCRMKSAALQYRLVSVNSICFISADKISPLSDQYLWFIRLRDVSRKNQFLPGTIRPGRFAQKTERDGSRKKTGTIRSKSNLEVDSPIFCNK